MTAHTARLVARTPNRYLMMGFPAASYLSLRWGGSSPIGQDFYRAGPAVHFHLVAGAERVAKPVMPTIVGMPISRATTAECERMLPRSIRMPETAG